MEYRNSPIDNKEKDISEIIVEFFNASSLSDSRQILEKHPELLNEETDLILDILSRTAQTKKTIDSINNSRNLLARCREMGIAQAFDDISSTSNESSGENYQNMIGEIMSISKPQDMPRKITLLQQALSLVLRQFNPMMWTVLQIELGNSLVQNPKGIRDDNLEHAIKHYNQAMEVFTRQEFPMEWADIQNRLGIIYWNLIRGNRAENIEQAIKHYNQALEVYTCQDFTKDWANTQNNLSAAYSDRIQGKKADNIEKAIEHLNQTLEVITRKDFPLEWANIQNNLAKAYLDRIRGNIAENIEKGIECSKKVLKVKTQRDFPKDWAKAQNNLGVAYWRRTHGNRAENIEQAIKHLKQALEVYTYQDFPVDWTMAQNNLGLAYKSRILGDSAENIEMAIKCCNKALEVRTQKDFPMDWALTQNNLATAYLYRIQGDRAENIEQAIKHLKQALEVNTQKGLPVYWAMTQDDLAKAYKDRILGDKAENIEMAIECCNKALEVRTQKDFPMDWATTHVDLATAYCNRVLGDKAENIKNAIKHYNQSLEVYTQEQFPMQWAMIQNNLGTAYWNPSLGDRAENLEKALEHYNQVFEVYKQKDFPKDWAMTQCNLAVAYRDRTRGDRTENIEQAINHFHKALEIYKLESMPSEFRRTCRLLGDLYFEMSNWRATLKSYKDAIEAGDLLYRSGLSAESKTVEIGENASIYRNAALASCHIDLATEALLVMERGKTRLLSEALKLKMKQPKGVPNEEWIKYEEAAKKYRAVTRPSNLSIEDLSVPLIGAEKYSTATRPFELKEDYAQKEKEVQKALEELDASIKVIRSYNSEFQKELDISDILSILDSDAALLAFCITSKGSIGFMVSGSKGVEPVDIHDFKTEDLNGLLFKLDKQGSITGGWVGNYWYYTSASNTYKYYLNAYEKKKSPETKKQLSEAYEHYKSAYREWYKTLDDVLSRIGSKLISPLVAKLPPHTKRLFLLPSGGLFLLPLHAVPINGQPLCHHFCISYAPSIPLLKEMQKDARTTDGKGLFAVINPQEDPELVFSGCEGQAISKPFKSRQVSVGKTGTRATVLEGVPGWAYLHFSCHGSYNWDEPHQSGLHLAGGRLSLADLQNDLVNISSARLVTLSACETGITDIVKSSADEFVGLPAGFMLAGVPCVVSSLWSVPDISTAILMERFYSNHITEGMDIPKALQDAQLWVRDLTYRQVADYVVNCYGSGKWEGKSKEFIEQRKEHYLEMAEKSPEEKPFQHPYYWAAFTVNGA